MKTLRRKPALVRQAFHLFVFCLLTETIYFVLRSSQHPNLYLVFLFQRCSGLLLAESQGSGNWQGCMWIKTASALGCFSLRRSDPVTRDTVQTPALLSHADG